MSDGTTGAWRPIHENHAIDVMALVVVFSQPLPDKLLRRVLRASEDTTAAAGLKSVTPTHNLQISLNQMPPSASVNGQIYSRLVENVESATNPTGFSEQLQIDQSSIIYKTWKYVSWKWQLEQARTLISPVLNKIQDVVSSSMIRFEYLDRFYFDADPKQAIVSDLLHEECAYAAPKLLKSRALWHNYSGEFIEEEQHRRRLRQVHIDVVDQQSVVAGDATIRRWVNCITALEDRFEPAFFDAADKADSFPFLSFDAMHTDLKSILASIINPSMSARIQLINK